MISYFDPERSEVLIVGKQCSLTFAKRRWFFSDFWITDAKSSPPLWKHKLTVYKSDGEKLIQALAVSGLVR